MSEHVQPQEQEQSHFQLPTKSQAIAVGGTLLATGLVDYGTHNIGFAIAGLVAAYAVGKLTPEVARALYPGSDPDATIAATKAIAEQIAPMAQYDDRPQDAMSKIRRLLNLKPSEQLEQPKDDRPSIGTPRPGPAQPTSNARIPGMFKVDSVLNQIREFNKKGYLYFGQGSSNKHVAIHYTKLYHLLDVCSSGSGKSNRLRLAMMQLVDFTDTYYINPLANTLKKVSDDRQFEVWTPLYERLAPFNGERKPMKSPADIQAIVQALAQEIKTREQQESELDFSWCDHPVFLFIDELPEIRKRCGDALIDELETVLTTGRQFLVYAYVASQSAAVGMIKQDEATQAQYKTRIYGGGDKGSANRVMRGPVPQEEETILHQQGPGLTLMLAEALERQFVRAPLVTNEGMFAFFGLSFNPYEHFPVASSTSFTEARRGGLSSYKPNTAQEIRELPAPQLPLVQPIAQAAQPTTLDAIMRLYEQDKIDTPMFCKLVDALPDMRAIESSSISPEPAQPELPPLSPELQKVLEIYQSGITDYRSVGKALGFGKDKAGELIQELRDRKLIV